MIKDLCRTMFGAVVFYPELIRKTYVAIQSMCTVKCRGLFFLHEALKAAQRLVLTDCALV